MNNVIEIPRDAWGPGCDPEFEPGHSTQPPCRLLTTIYVNDCPMHLEAIAIALGEDGVQRGLCVYGEQNLSAAAQIYCDGGFETIEIDGHPYVLVATPHC